LKEQITMPLSQHDQKLDYDGSWADASKDWPCVVFKSKVVAKQAYVVCWKHARIPYGCYVLVDNELRVESETHKKKLLSYLTLVGINPNLQDLRKEK